MTHHSTKTDPEGAILTIDLEAITANYKLLSEKSNGAITAGVLKANAYGLGSEKVGPALHRAGCRTFCVAHITEGIKLRKILPKNTTIYILHGALPGAEEYLVEHNLIPALNSPEQISAWQSLAKNIETTLPAILHVDTGMSRLGLSPDEFKTLVENKSSHLDGIELRYVMSHLASAPLPEDPMNALQLERFNFIRSQLPNIPGSLANSSGIFLGSEYHFDMVRPGICLYGGSPEDGKPSPMQQVVRLQGKVIQLRTLKPGDGIGYSQTFHAKTNMRIAVVAVGYADGFFRKLSNQSIAHYNNIPLPLVGRVSMDMLTLDVSSVPEGELRPGSLIDLISHQHPIEDLGKEAETISYEVLTNLGNRYQRNYVGGEQ